MTTINGVRIQPGFFKQRNRKQVEYRVSDAPASARPKRTSVAKPKGPHAKYAMPAVAIIGAIGSFTAGAAIATAAGASLGAVIVGGAMMVGAAMTVVGTVTKNEKLAKWGGYLSLAGGVGAMALGAMGMLSSAANTTTEAALGAAVDSVDAAAGGAVADMGAGAASGAAGDALSGAAGVAADAGVTTGAAGGGMMSPTSPDGFTSTATPLTSAPPPTPTPVPGAEATTAAAPALDASPLQTATASPTPQTPQTPAWQASPSDLAPAPGDSTVSYQSPNLPKNEMPSMWDQFNKWWDNPKNAGAKKVIMDGVGGMMNNYQNADVREAQINAMNAQANNANANADATREQAYKLWLRTFYAQGKMPPPGSNSQNYNRMGG